MKKGVKKIWFSTIGIIGLCFFLFHSTDLVAAKDPDYPTRPITCYISFSLVLIYFWSY